MTTKRNKAFFTSLRFNEYDNRAFITVDICNQIFRVIIPPKEKGSEKVREFASGLQKLGRLIELQILYGTKTDYQEDKFSEIKHNFDKEELDEKF